MSGANATASTSSNLGKGTADLKRGEKGASIMNRQIAECSTKVQKKWDEVKALCAKTCDIPADRIEAAKKDSAIMHVFKPGGACDTSAKQKYLKYKQKYLDLKNQLNL